MERYLIINADDFGMCRAQNAATMELLLRGAVTSATIMAPCPHAAEAVAFAARHPAFSVGVHLTTTSEWSDYRWGPIAEHVPSLTDTGGMFFHGCGDFACHAKLDEVERELTAQIEWLMQRGLSPSHFDNHMGSLYGIGSGDFRLLFLAISLASRYRVPFRFPAKFCPAMLSNGMLDIHLPEQAVRSALAAFSAEAESKGVLTPDYLLPGDWEGEQDRSYENYREYLFELYRSFDHGVTETYVHPAAECDELKAITPAWHRRVWEYRLLRDPATADFIRSLGIRLIGYRELEQIRGGVQ